MSSLHVCIDLITLPSGRLIAIGLVASFTLMTGVPGSRKYPVAPASDIGSSTPILIRPVLKHVSAFGRPRKFCCTIVCSHAVDLLKILCEIRTLVPPSYYGGIVCNYM